jgi:hypothetical protein
VRARVGPIELRGRAVETDRSQDIEDLHHDVVVAAALRDADGSIGERSRGFVVGVGEQHRNTMRSANAAYAQSP